MKIITLNVWGGKIHQPLLSFIKNNSSTDIFCFQEVFNYVEDVHDPIIEDLTNTKGINPHLYQDISALSPNHQGFFCPVYRHKTLYGIAMFVKKDISVLDSGDI